VTKEKVVAEDMVKTAPAEKCEEGEGQKKLDYSEQDVATYP
jgi:hypothetical protein